MDTITPFSPTDVAIGLNYGLSLFFAVMFFTRRARERPVYILAFMVKLLACVVYSALAIVAYYGDDTTGYHVRGSDLANQLLSSLGSDSTSYFGGHPLWSLAGSSADRMDTLSGVVHLLTLNSFLATSMCYALAGFAGQVLIYRVFIDRYPDPRLRRWWQGSILFFPTLTLWSAGLLKDPLGILGLGCGLWSFHRLSQTFRFRYLVGLAASVYLLLLFRVQVAPALLVAMVPVLIATPRAAQNRFIQRLKHIPGRPFPVLVGLALATASLAAVHYLSLVDARMNISTLPTTLSGAASAYGGDSSVATTTSWTGLLASWPSAVVLTLYRPFIWEARNLLQLLAALENLGLLILSGRAIVLMVRSKAVAAHVVRQPMFLACVIFVLLFSLGIGASTPNVGSISRYRIPLIPFMFGILIIIEYEAMIFRVRLSRREESQAVTRSVRHTSVRVDRS